MEMLCYLAMTGAEFAATVPLPAHIGWMACHFSGYSTGLSNLPSTLPEGSMIIVNDRIPLHRHDPQRILEQLQELCDCFTPSYILLDLQRPGETLVDKITALLIEQLSCPVGVSPLYARDLPCPVFLPPPDPHIPLQEHFAPWEGREIWLEAALETGVLTVDRGGCHYLPEETSLPNTPVFQENTLHFSYQTQIQPDRVCFHIRRNTENLQALLLNARKLGATLAIGLYQQLGAFTLQQNSP